ncbi:unnamed protein product [Gordionus sp. m RMFG-2023]
MAMMQIFKNCLLQNHICCKKSIFKYLVSLHNYDIWNYGIDLYTSVLFNWQDVPRFTDSTAKAFYNYYSGGSNGQLYNHVLRPIILKMIDPKKKKSHKASYFMRELCQKTLEKLVSNIQKTLYVYGNTVDPQQTTGILVPIFESFKDENVIRLICHHYVNCLQLTTANDHFDAVTWYKNFITSMCVYYNDQNYSFIIIKQLFLSADTQQKLVVLLGFIDALESLGYPNGKDLYSHNFMDLLLNHPIDTSSNSERIVKDNIVSRETEEELDSRETRLEGIEAEEGEYYLKILGIAEKMLGYVFEEKRCEEFDHFSDNGALTNFIYKFLNSFVTLLPDIIRKPIFITETLSSKLLKFLSTFIDGSHKGISSNFLLHPFKDTPHFIIFTNFAKAYFKCHVLQQTDIIRKTNNFQVINSLLPNLILNEDFPSDNKREGSGSDSTHYYFVKILIDACFEYYDFQQDNHSTPHQDSSENISLFSENMLLQNDTSSHQSNQIIAGNNLDRRKIIKTRHINERDREDILNNKNYLTRSINDHLICTLLDSILLPAIQQPKTSNHNQLLYNRLSKLILDHLCCSNNSYSPRGRKELEMDNITLDESLVAILQQNSGDNDSPITFEWGNIALHKANITRDAKIVKRLKKYPFIWPLMTQVFSKINVTKPITTECAFLLRTTMSYLLVHWEGDRNPYAHISTPFYGLTIDLLTTLNQVCPTF